MPALTAEEEQEYGEVAAAVWHEEKHGCSGFCSKMIDYYCGRRKLQFVIWMHKNCDDECTGRCRDEWASGRCEMAA